MPKKLGLLIDTVTQQGSIALYSDKTLIYEKIFSPELNHLRALHPSIIQMLQETGITLKEIDYYGVDIGPGSFTGVRIGVTSARTFAQAEKKHIFGAVSLDILSMKAPSLAPSGLICAVVDGKKSRVFTAFYILKNKTPERISSYFDIEPEKLIFKINKYKNKYNEVMFLGSGQQNYSELLKQTELKSIFTDEKYYYPEAKYIVNCLKKSKLTKNYEKILPFYLRLSDAEIK